MPDFAELHEKQLDDGTKKEQRKVHESSVELFSEQQNNTGKKLFLFQLALFPACVHFSLPTRLTFIRPSSAIVLCKGKEDEKAENQNRVVEKTHGKVSG